MDDDTEVRSQLVQLLNTYPKGREMLETAFGQVWDTQQLQEDYEVHGFLAPFCLVTRKRDNVTGSLIFQHLPRFYFEFDHKSQKEATNG